MTAAIRVRRRETGGLRPLDQARDLAAVADLIEGAFSGGIDAEGRRMLREMRWLGKSGGLARLLLWMFLPASPYRQGYVWEEAGRVVGNVSLMPVGEDAGRWVLANVVVDPSYRGRGIGRALVEASLEHVRRRRGAAVILQVEAGNSIAQKLYRSLGFQVRSTRASWEREAGARTELLPDSDAVRPQKSEEWRLAYALASKLHPEGLVWPLPLRPDQLRPGPFAGTLGVQGRGSWAWLDEGTPRGFLEARPLPEARGWRLMMLVDPAWQGEAEGPLLARAIRCLGRGRCVLTAEYPDGIAEQAFLGAGFRRRRVLTWMEKSLHSVGGTTLGAEARG